MQLDMSVLGYTVFKQRPDMHPLQPLQLFSGLVWCADLDYFWDSVQWQIMYTLSWITDYFYFRLVVQVAVAAPLWKCLCICRPVIWRYFVRSIHNNLKPQSIFSTPTCSISIPRLSTLLYVNASFYHFNLWWATYIIFLSSPNSCIKVWCGDIAGLIYWIADIRWVATTYQHFAWWEVWWIPASWIPADIFLSVKRFGDYYSNLLTHHRP